MAEYIEREAFLVDKKWLYCTDCDKRKGKKRGKMVTLYEIGEAPCKSCGIHDMLEEVEAYPAADVRPVVLCKDCRHRDPEDHKCDCGQLERAGCVFPVDDDYLCAYGEKREER
jgi:hypothetical protein